MQEAAFLTRLVVLRAVDSQWSSGIVVIVRDFNLLIGALWITNIELSTNSIYLSDDRA
jgi:hypothetical protein